MQGIRGGGDSTKPCRCRGGGRRNARAHQPAVGHGGMSRYTAKGVIVMPGYCGVSVSPDSASVPMNSTAARSMSSRLNASSVGEASLELASFAISISSLAAVSSGGCGEGSLSDLVADTGSAGTVAI